MQGLMLTLCILHLSSCSWLLWVYACRRGPLQQAHHIMHASLQLACRAVTHRLDPRVKGAALPDFAPGS